MELLSPLACPLQESGGEAVDKRPHLPIRENQIKGFLCLQVHGQDDALRDSPSMSEGPCGF